MACIFVGTSAKCINELVNGDSHTKKGILEGTLKEVLSHKKTVSAFVSCYCFYKNTLVNLSSKIKDGGSSKVKEILIPDRTNFKKLIKSSEDNYKKLQKKSKDTFFS